MRSRYDAGSKWLIESFATELLQVAGVGPLTGVRVLPNELVQSRQLPDGLVEVTFPDRPDPVLYLIEVNTYSYAATANELLDDVLMTHLSRRRIPEVVAITLHDRGNVRVDSSIRLASPFGHTALEARWRVVNLWEVNARDFLPIKNPGYAPWVPLMKIDGPPESVLRQCRDAIDRIEEAERREHLLGVTSVLASLRFSESLIEKLFKPEGKMIETPLLTKWFRERDVAMRQRVVLEALEARFGAPVPNDVSAAVRVIDNEERLQALLPLAYSSDSLSAFRQALTPPANPAN